MVTCQWPWYPTPRLRHRLSQQRQSHLGSIKIQEPQGRGGGNRRGEGGYSVNQGELSSEPSSLISRPFAVTQPEPESAAPGSTRGTGWASLIKNNQAECRTLNMFKPDIIIIWWRPRGSSSPPHWCFVFFDAISAAWLEMNSLDQRRWRHFNLSRAFLCMTHERHARADED